MTETNTNTVKSHVYPAYTVVEVLPPEGAEKIVPVEITHDKSIRLPFTRRRTGETLWHEFKPGSVVRYAQQYKEDPIAAIDRARKLGHKLHWLNSCGVSITSHARPHETYIGLHFGDEVIFEGIRFRIEKAPNDNAELVRVEEEVQA